MTFVSYVLNKILLRSLFAAIVPIVTYQIGYGIGSALGVVDFPFFNNVACLIIAAFAFPWPFSNISLWMLFEPIMAFLNYKLWIDPSKVPQQGDGAFAPIDYEDKYEIMKVSSGKIPSDIQGVYLRNGPNPKFQAESNRAHLFDGDGMIHAIRIKDGRLFYCNRLIQTPRVLCEIESKKPCFIRIGEFVSVWGFMKVPLLAF